MATAKSPHHQSTKDSSAHLSFEATARRGSANPKGEAIPRSLSPAKDNLWLSADSRNAVEPERSGDSPAKHNTKPGQTAEGNRSNLRIAAF